MSVLEAVKSFIRRRVQIDVGPNDIVLDVGSGLKPHWRADVLLEKHPTSSAQQRSESGSAVIHGWMVVGNIENMPFRDKVFDYVITSHVLEHVEYPDRAILELQRVGKRGYIELPFEGMQKLDDFPSHLWYTHLEDDQLVFTAKEGQVFDPYIDQLISPLKNTGLVEKFELYNPDAWIVEKLWQDQILYEVRGELPKRFVHEVLNLPEVVLEPPLARRFARALFSALLRFAYRNKIRESKVDIASLLRCCECSSESFDLSNGGYTCSNCGKFITVLR